MVKFRKSIITVLSVLFFIPVQSESRIVSHVKISEVGIPYKNIHAKNLIRDCAIFRPTEEQIVHFFNVAKESEDGGPLMHEFYSPCISMGTVTFKDGVSGTWVLQSSGLASFFINGEKKSIFFTRDNKWDDPFGCVYGLDDAPSC